jgi:hypothetical protein
MNAFDDAIALDEIHAFERNVKASVFGVAEKHEFAAASLGFDEAEAFKLTDAVIDVNDKIAGLQLGEITEETRGANFAAGTFDGGSNVEKVTITVKSDLGFRKGNAGGKRGAEENEGRGFGCVFRGETGGGFFGFAENIGDFVFTADIGEALKFAEAGGGEIGGATVSELRLDIGEAGDNVAVEARCRARSEFKARAAVGGQAELLKFNARSFMDGAIEIGFVPEIMGDFRGVGLAVALVILGGGIEMLAGCFAEVDGLIEEDERLERTLGKFKERGGACFPAAANPAGGFPVQDFVAAGSGDAPLGERKNGGFDDGSDGTLGAGIKFANALDGVAEKFETNGTRCFGRENVDDAATNSELAREVDHFGAGITGAGEMSDEFLVRDFRVFGESAREG